MGKNGKAKKKIDKFYKFANYNFDPYLIFKIFNSTKAKMLVLYILYRKYFMLLNSRACIHSFM